MLPSRPDFPRPLSVKLFAVAIRVLLPSSLHEEFAEDLETTLLDQQRAVRREAISIRAAFWVREIWGLIATAFRESYPRSLGDRRKRRRVNPPAPKRSRNMISSLRQDATYAFRMILKTPVVTIIAVVSLAIGIAANTTIFSLVNSWLLKPLPYPDADRLVLVWQNDRVESDDTENVTVANFWDWRAEATSLGDWTASQFQTMNLTGLDRPEQLTIARVTPDYFRVLGAEPMLGRTFHIQEGGTEDSPVAVVSETLWKNRFGAAPDLIGSTVVLDGRSYSVVGIMPETFDFLLGTVGIWVASDFGDQRHNREDQTLLVTARVIPGVTVQQAQSELTALAARLETQHPETNEGIGVNVETLRDAFPGETDTGLVQILMAVVVLVLLIACVNVASLLMAKTDARQKEIAVRVALGAGKGRLVRQLLTESVILALIAGALGTALSVWGVGFLNTAFPPEIPANYYPTIDGTVLGFSVAISLLAGLTFGLTPATQAVGGSLHSPLVEGSRGGTATRRKKRIRGAFVMAEFALALTILVGAATLTDLFHRKLAIDPGFDPDNVIKMELTLPEYKYTDDASRVAFFDEVQRRIATVRGVRAFAFASALPRTRYLPLADFTIDGLTYGVNEQPSTSWLTISPEYFGRMGIEVRAGRAFTDTDRSETHPVIIVNQRMVDQYFDGDVPLGRRITIHGESREVIGVAANIAQTRLSGLMAPSATVYFPLAQEPVPGMNILLRAQADPYQLASPVQSVVWEVDRDQPITAVQTIQEYVATQLAGPNTMTRILFIVGLLALALAAIGIYGVMAYSVSQQTSEIGVRMALGAKPRQVLMRIGRQGLRLAGTGLLLGVPLAALVVNFIGSIVTNAASEGLEITRTLSTCPIATVAAILIAVGLVACAIPARRATKFDPMVALQTE
ncbi:MAG: ABC transporter permease [Gemmatimonadales bacterium]